MGKHFVLVHSAGHGAWYWYKVKPLLESSGHQVTALQLAPSVINVETVNEVRSLSEYTQPLMDFMASVPEGEKVILVGHSAGGSSLPLAMEQYPQKISVAVFITAFMPDITHKPSYVVDEYLASIPDDGWKDTQVIQDEPVKWLLFGPNFLKSTLYELCSLKDFALVMFLNRPASFFQEDLSTMPPYSEQGYGSIDRVYIVCKEDNAISDDFQRWMIKNYPVKEVKEIEYSGHEPMLSRPLELCSCLFDVANKY